jgi:hypothetical protein
MTTKIIDKNTYKKMGITRCDCCGRHINELKPFTKQEFPNIGANEGQFLIWRYRRMGPYNEESVEAWYEWYKVYDEFVGTGDNGKDSLTWMQLKYGKEKGEELYYADQFYATADKTNECKDCINLNADEYFETIKKRFEKEEKIKRR